MPYIVFEDRPTESGMIWCSTMGIAEELAREMRARNVNDIVRDTGKPFFRTDNRNPANVLHKLELIGFQVQTSAQHLVKGISDYLPYRTWTLHRPFPAGVPPANVSEHDLSRRNKS